MNENFIITNFLSTWGGYHFISCDDLIKGEGKETRRRNRKRLQRLKLDTIVKRDESRLIFSLCIKINERP